VGTLFFRVRHVGSDETFEVDTPNLAFNVTEPGQYRIDVDENGDQTIATVWHGGAEITGGGSSYRLGEGQQGTFSGVDQLRYDVSEIGRDDDFSRWCLDRDRRLDRVRSAQYVSPEMTGYEDLDEYGRWHNDPEYGNVWTPVNVAYDWAPYRYGHWVYISPWGWTWVEDEPWGFAPFHYGRWAYRGAWFWVPGPVAVVPCYSPALVVANTARTRRRVLVITLVLCEGGRQAEYKPQDACKCCKRKSCASVHCDFLSAASWPLKLYSW